MEQKSGEGSRESRRIELVEDSDGVWKVTFLHDAPEQPFTPRDIGRVLRSVRYAYGLRARTMRLKTRR